MDGITGNRHVVKTERIPGFKMHFVRISPTESGRASEHAWVIIYQCGNAVQAPSPAHGQYVRGLSALHPACRNIHLCKRCLQPLVTEAVVYKQPSIFIEHKHGIAAAAASQYDET